MATPKELVERELEKQGLSKAKLMKLIGYQSGFSDFWALFVNKPWQLTDEKREQIAAVLGKSPDWLKEGGEEVERKREHYLHQEFKKYLESDVGRAADPETHRILESMQWTGKWLPDVRLYQTLTLVMEGRYTPAQVLDALELEAEDRKVEQKNLRPKKRTKAT